MTVVPTVFFWVTVTVALIWFIATTPVLAAKNPLVAATVVRIELRLNLYLSILWLSALRTSITLR